MAKKNKGQLNANYLENIPVHAPDITWDMAEDGLVTLHVENKGVMNRIAQLVFRKPKVSHIHLDENGSFVWPLIDGKKSITELGVPVKEHFGEAAEPLYPRLAKYFQILESYKFIQFTSTSDKDVK